MNDQIKHSRQLLGMAKSWAISNLPGWADEMHRDLIARHGAAAVDGKVSATTMSAAQLRSAIDDYEQRGWPRQRRTFKAGGTAKTVSPQIAHIVRLWSRLGNTGKIERTDRASLLSFCARQTKRDVPDLDSLGTEECQQIIEALKGWSRRN